MRIGGAVLLLTGALVMQQHGTVPAWGNDDAWLARQARAANLVAVTGIRPDSGMQQKVVALVVQGDGFEPGAEIELIGSSVTLLVDGEWFLHPSLIGGSVDLAGTPVGFYTVHVINPTGLDGALVDGFEVVASLP